MNIHIELAKKSLADNDSVSLEELKANVEAAESAREAASWAAEAASWAAEAAASGADDHAEYCKQQAIEAIEKYEELKTC